MKKRKPNINRKEDLEAKRESIIEKWVPKTDVGKKVKAGEIDFHGLRSELSLERLTWITGLHVIDSKGFPAAGARVYIEGRFIGATGNDGNLPIRWKDYPPMVRVLFRGKETLSNLVPGTVQVVIPDY